jgi:ataxin-10
VKFCSSTACHGVFFISLSVYFGQFEFYIVFLFFADMSYGGGSMVARNEWLEMLITHLCLIEEQCFPLLFTELGIPRTATQHLPQQPEAPLSHKLETKLPSKEQASLLEILCVWIEEDGGKAREETAEGGGDSLIPPRPPLLPMECAGFLVDVIRHAAQCAASDGLCATAFPTNMPVLDVLGLSLSMARIHCAWDKTLTSAKEPNGETITMAAKLASNGLIALMLDMLQALGPPQSARPGVPPEHSTNKSDLQQSRRMTVNVGSDSAETDAALSNKEISIEHKQARRSSFLHCRESFPTWNPYKGYRRDIVAVIANASYRNFHIQEEVRETDGLYLVLEQCTTDSNNPFLREWGLWAIRNLLEGNPRNQHEFADLEAKASVANPELRDIGISVELNPETGRPRLVNVSNAEGNHEAETPAK